MNLCRRTIFALCSAYLLTFVTAEKVYTDEFAVHIRGGRSVADELAVKYGYVNKGQIGELRDHYLFQHNHVQRRSVLPSEGDHTFLDEEPMVEWMEQQHIKKRVKRDFIELTDRAVEDRLSVLQEGVKSLDDKQMLEKPIKDAKLFSDPYYSDQWYMDRSNAPTMKVEEAWKLGVTGEGVVVSILDDGIEMNHPDLKLNFDQQASSDVNGHKKNPSPRYDYADTNRHGTRCAGEVAMQADNGICGVGVAYNASIGGVRMLDGDVTDFVEATSLSFARRHIDIYSASWGPDDDGRTVDGPGKLAKQAFKEGVTKGRHGLGSIYVWASGNGGHVDDSCNCDGYANSIYTLSISSTSENGVSPWYLESCASTLATTYSSGSRQERKVITTDLHQRCTSEHTGTSASAPLAAGIIALALQANPTLTWRDVQYLVVRTSRKENLKAEDWVRNAAGYEVSHLYGFGLMDAEAMVQEARSWRSLPEQRICEINIIDKQRTIEGTDILRIPFNTTACAGTGNYVRYLEHVQANMTLTFSKRGALTIRLTSPQKTKSTILPSRRGDQRPGGFNDWAFMSTHYWGEEASGTWVLEVENTGFKTYSGKITKWNLVLYGTEAPPLMKHQKKPRSNHQDYDPWGDESWHDPSWKWDSFSSSYDDDNCHEECWDTGCDGPGAEDCFKCKHYRDRLTDKCVQYCPPGQFPPTYLHERCKFCNGDCKTCVGREAWDCTSCPDGLVLMAGECLDECEDGFFKDKGDNMCHRCDDLCAECKEAPDNCQKCVPGAVLDDTECKLSCPSSYYLQDGQCTPCHVSCASCHGPGDSACTSCDPVRVHKGQYCVDPSECGEGWYISRNAHGGEISEECIECHQSCRTCDGFSYDDCLSCKDNAYLNNGACEPDCKDGTYKSPDDGECHDCPDGCTLCITESICIACEDQRVLNAGVCSEGCEEGSYEYAGECFNCHDLCQECVDGGLTDCTKCKQDNGNRYLLEGACLPFCPSGYFMDDDSLTCRECDETCRRCDSTRCIECMDENVDAGENWVCGEDEHTGECDPKCATCMSDALDQCLTCASGLYMHNYDCVETCPKGFFADDNRDSCRLCHPTCKTCDGFHVHDCLSCDHEYVLTPVGERHSTCETHCPEGTFEVISEEVGDSGRQCANCHDSCSTCDGPEEWECVTCDGRMFLQVNWRAEDQMPERKCVEQCEVGTFGAPDDGECLPCQASCETCTNEPNYCLSCIEGYDLDGNTCKNQQGCRDDQFTNEKGDCENCHYTCEKCSGPDDDECLSCKFYRFWTDEGRCEEVCPEGTYSDFDMNTCLPCHATCDGCVMGGASDCLECKPGLYSYPYDGQACLKSCPEGFYELEEGSTKTCQQCSLECRDCHDSYWQCISCNDDTFLFQDRCVTACPYGYHEDEEANHCLQDDDVRFPCPLYCQECDDWGDCRVCNDGYVPYYGECVKDGEQTCPDGKFPTINEQDELDCLNCDSTCATCQGPGDDECLSCKANHRLNRGTCETSCSDGTYAYTNDEDEDVCLACHPTCATCDGPSPNQCLSCKENLKLDGEHHSCHVNCPAHSFFSNSGCQHCNETCGTCNGFSANNCLTCEDGRYHLAGVDANEVIIGMCVQVCPSGTFHYRPSDDSTDDYECQVCHASCETCFGETDSECTSCPSNTYRQGFTCKTTCNEGYYPDKDSICQRCHLTCESCSGPDNNHCVSCADELFLQEGYCREECTMGWFEQPGHKCGECHPRCLSCTEEGPFHCETCHGNYMLVNNTCYNRCKIGQFWTNETCKQCDATCLECYGPNEYHCIDCPNGLLLKRLHVNHSSCVRCCRDNEDVNDKCCPCNDKRDKCLKASGAKNPKKTNSSSSAHAHLHTGTIVLGVILAIAFFFTIFCLLQARSNKMWCFKDSYDKLPAYYDSKGNHVIMSKQYQHEKINVMSDDEDFYEDIDSEEEED